MMIFAAIVFIVIWLIPLVTSIFTLFIASIIFVIIGGLMVSVLGKKNP